MIYNQLTWKLKLMWLVTWSLWSSQGLLNISVRTIFQGKVSFVTAMKVTDLKVNLYKLSFEINLKGIMQFLHIFARWLSHHYGGIWKAEKKREVGENRFVFTFKYWYEGRQTLLLTFRKKIEFFLNRAAHLCQISQASACSRHLCT